MNYRLFRYASALLVLGATAYAQETSVKPGINDSFKDPDVDRYIKMFEGESRVIYKFRNEIVAALNLEQGMEVADIGAGTGFFSLMIAEKIGPDGTVHSVDIAENFIEHIAKISAEQGVDNIKGIVGTPRSTTLPAESVDLVYICDTYHHFEYPNDTLASVHQALRPGGQLVIVDFERVKGIQTNWIMNHVRCGKGTVSDEVRDAGFDLVEEVDLMEEQYVLRFEKRAPNEDE